jgi:hypothetical protein
MPQCHGSLVRSTRLILMMILFFMDYQKPSVPIVSLVLRKR